MNDSPRFDEARSAAIRSALIEAVEQSPGRDHRRHIRVAIAAVLAAIGLGVGGAAVAFALSGTGPFGDDGTAAAPPTTSAVSTPLATPSPTVEPATPAAHPLVVTGDPIAPHDLLSPPSSTPAWTVQLPGLYDKCTFTRVIDVADGFALFESGPTTPPEDSAYDCDLSLSRFALTMIDTSTGVEAWSREWSWPYVYGNPTEATLLGTSGRVLVWDVRGAGPREVLDLATGVTTAPVVEPAGLDVGTLYSVPGDSGDVSFVAQQLDAAGQPTNSWSVMRADPQDLSAPRWSVAFDAESAVTARITNSSSMLQVTRQPTGELDVYDVDSGALMVGSTSGRSYSYYDGFTLRTSWNDDLIARTIAGIDDAGNEIWSRSLPDTSYDLAPVVRIDAQPGGDGSPLVSEFMLIGPGTQLQLVDGVTGETRWTADGSACAPSGALNGAAISDYGFTVGPDDVLVQYGEGGAACGFDHASGAAVDVSERPGIWLGVQGVLAQYQLQGGAGTGGVYSDRMQAAPPTPMPQNGTATALDAVTGASLWTIPIYGDERWTFAGGYLVGFSQGKVFGIG